jgi:hypothetical protein
VTNHDPREHPENTEPAEPYIGGRRPVVGPLLGVIGVIVLIAVVFLLITWLQHNT